MSQVSFNPSWWVYDIETYPNIFTACFIHAVSGEVRRYEISDRRDDSQYLHELINWFKLTGAKAVGFNNVGFDYPVLHDFARGGDPYNKAQQIIDGNDRWGNIIWDNDRLFEQIDLYMIHHFDNQAKRTSLKDLEIAMRSDSVQDLPFPPGTNLTHDEMDELHRYNEKDVRETLDFLKESLEMIEFRNDLSAQYGRNFTNFNDTKIGAEIFITELERAGIECYYRDSSGKRSRRQTFRSGIPVKDVIFPYIKFERPEFQAVLDRLNTETIYDTRRGFGSLHAIIDGFQFDYGMGGIHGSIQSAIVYENEQFAIVDIDVKSYYPNLSIKNRYYPEHLTDKFCDVYEELYKRRAATPKSDPINGALKLALNGTYGNSNNEYSVFYDPLFTMKTTINGQLLLTMLAEQLLKIPQLTMVQANTDGITVRLPREWVDHMHTVCEWWEGLTQLELEYVEYSMMAVRDVNNYMAVTTDGYIKRKGAYEYKVGWHQNPSQLVVQKAVEAHLVHGVDVTSFILSHRDPFDFMIRAKVQRNCKLYFGDRETQRITRYFVALRGDEVVKLTPTKEKPGTWKKARGVSDAEYDAWVTQSHDVQGVQLDSNGVPHNPEIHTKSKTMNQDSRSRFAAGWQCVECANAEDFDWSNVNYTYYIDEAMKLIDPLKGGH